MSDTSYSASSKYCRSSDELGSDYITVLYISVGFI